jgi:hypothetical protein
MVASHGHDEPEHRPWDGRGFAGKKFPARPSQGDKENTIQNLVSGSGMATLKTWFSNV